MKPVAFFSYTRLDDARFGMLGRLQEDLEYELKKALPEVEEPLFRDVDNIRQGENWRKSVERALDDATVIIPVVSPLFLASQACRQEVGYFLQKLAPWGRDDVVMPIYWCPIPGFPSKELARHDPLLRYFEGTNFATWTKHQWMRPVDYEGPDGVELRKALVAFAHDVADRHRSVLAVGPPPAPPHPIEPFDGVRAETIVACVDALRGAPAQAPAGVASRPSSPLSAEVVGPQISPDAETVANNDADGAVSETRNEAVFERRYMEVIEVAMSAVGAKSEPEEVERALRSLRRERRFAELHFAAVTARQVGRDTPSVRLFEAQALIELNAFDAAREVLDGILAGADADTLGFQYALEVKGMLGRSYKAEYLQWAAGNPDAAPGDREAGLLGNAIKVYLEAYRAHADASLWLGVNALALYNRAAIDCALGQIEGVDGVSLRGLATEILAHVKQIVADSGAPTLWVLLTATETCVALGRWREAKRYVDQAIAFSPEPFFLNGLLRQLTEVWRLDQHKSLEARRLLVTLKTAIVTAGGTAVFSPSTESEILSAMAAEARPPAESPTLATTSGDDVLVFERLATPLSIPLFLRTSRFSNAVAMIEVRSRDGWVPRASGFLLEGGLLKQDWSGRAVLLTCEHAVSDAPMRPRDLTSPYRLDDVGVRFEGSVEAKTVRFQPQSTLWRSVREAHDVAVLELDSTPSDVSPIDRATTTFGKSFKLDDPENFPPLMIIGHPRGEGLEISLGSSKLLEHNAPAQGRGDPVRLRYLAPTEPGSGGGPVFDMDRGELLGIHHMHGRLPRFDGPGRVFRNEAIAIASIRDAIAVSPSGWPPQKDASSA